MLTVCDGTGTEQNRVRILNCVLLGELMQQQIPQSSKVIFFLVSGSGFLDIWCGCVWKRVRYLRVVGQVDLSGDVVHGADPLRRKHRDRCVRPSA